MRLSESTHSTHCILSARKSIVQAAAKTLERLESRQMFCSLHMDDAIDSLAPSSEAILEALRGDPGIQASDDHQASWYEPVQTISTLSTVQIGKISSGETATTGDNNVRVYGPVLKSELDSSAVGMANAVADPVSYNVNAAGLPLLTSRADGQGLKIFLDWDGASGNGFSDTGFSTDSDLTTFNASEQAVIYDTWRDIVSYFSFLNVNVTTVQPPTGGSNPAFVWHRITNSRAGGAAYVNWIVNYESHGYTNSDNALYRHSGIAHEIGHQLGLAHQSNFDDNGVKTQEYTGGYDNLHGPIMGIDYNGTVKKFYNGRGDYGADYLQNDVSIMTDIVNNFTGGDGYLPDDFIGTSTSTATTLSLTEGGYQTAGNIEKLTDADWFSFISGGGMFSVNVEPTFESGLAPKLEIYNSTGTLISSLDDTLYRFANDNNSVEVNLNLPSGTYYAKVSSHGDIGDQGEYAFYASPLPTGWNTTDVNKGYTGNGGYVTYDASTGTFHQGGTGADIWGTSDGFRFSYQVLNGDGSITARVSSLIDTGSAAKAGVMIRQSLNANSAHAYVGIVPSGNIETIRRTSAGASAANVNNTGTGPWVKLIRAGNVFTYQRSADGVTWTTLGTSTITMSGAVYIGLAVCSWNLGNQTTATFDNVALAGSLGTTPATANGLAAPAITSATAVAAASNAMTINWSDVVGETGYTIERSLDGVNFSQIGTTTADATTYTDNPNWGSMRWWYRVAALNALGKSDYSNSVSVINKPGQPYNPQIIRINSSKLSLFWRDVAGDTGYRLERSIDGGTNYVTISANTGQSITTYNDTGLNSGTTYTYRITPLSSAGDGIPLIVAQTTPPVSPTGLTLTNLTATSITVNWSQVTGAASYQVYRSTDNTTFSQIGTVSSGTTITYADATVNPLTNYYYYVVAVGTGGITSSPSSTVRGSSAPSAALPSGWLDSDIPNSPVLTTGIGDAGGSNNSFTINSGGADIANTDAFHFVYQPITTNATVIARVTGIGISSDGAKAGLMIRQNLTSATSPYAGIFVNAGGTWGIDVRSRNNSSSGYSYGSAVSSAFTPYYLKLVRNGNSIITSYSTDGINYVTPGTGTRTVVLSGTVYVGLAVTANSTSLNTQATFTNVMLAASNDLTPPTVVTAASASPNPVTGTTTNVSVLGTDNSGESGLVYSWSATGPGSVSFSSNGSNAAKSSVATFSHAGIYTITATLTDAGLNSVSSSTTVTVNQTFSGIVAAAPTQLAGFSQQISPADQFGKSMSVSGLNWSSNNGSISSTGIFTSPGTGSSTSIVTATNGISIYNTTINNIIPRAWYKADSASGSSLVDASGNARTGTLTSNYSYTTGKINNALNLSTGYGSLPTGIVAGQTEMTIAAWVNPTSNPSWARIFDFGTGTTTNMFLTANPGGANTLRFAITTGGGGAEQQMNGSALPTGTWSHIAITIASNGNSTYTGTMYLNGVSIATKTDLTLTASSLGNTNLNYIGKSQYSDPNYVGAIDDFRIYGAAASASTIASLYAAGNAYGIAAPSGLSASAISSNQIDVSWTDNSTAETGYLLERSTNSLFTTGLSTFNLPDNISSYSDTSVSASTTYYYRLSTLLAGGTTTNPITTPPVTTPSAFPSIINGTTGNDSYYVKRSGTLIQVWIGDGSGSPTYQTDINSITTLSINGSDSSDTLVIDYSAGDPVPAGGIHFDGGIGGDTINLIGSGSTDNFNLSSVATAMHNSTSVTRTGVETVALTSGNFTIGANLSGANLQLTGSTTSAQFATSQNLNALNISSGASATSSSTESSLLALSIGDVTLNNGTLAIALNGTISGASKFNSLSIIGTGKLDLHNNDLIIDYGTGASPYTTIRDWVKSGLTLLGGNGMGIGATEVDNQTLGGTVLGVIDNGTIDGGITSVSGVAVSTNSVLVKYTWFGDANFDGAVTGEDYALIDTGFTGGGGLTGWIFGDFNFDGSVTGDDYALIDTGFIAQDRVL